MTLLLTLTLFDMEAITGLRLDGGNLEPNENDEESIEFDSNRADFTRYIEN